jgi:hypothetical protein
MDQKCVADVGDSAVWLSVVLLRLANLPKKKIPHSRWVSKIKPRSKNHSTTKFYTINRLKISVLEISAIFYYNNKFRVRFEVFRVVTMRITTFQDGTLCCLVDCY